MTKIRKKEKTSAQSKKNFPIKKEPLLAPKNDTPILKEVFVKKKQGFAINTHYVLFFLMTVVFFGCYTLIKPYIHTILLAVILASVGNPIHKRIEQALGGRKNLSAALSCFLLTITVVIPLFFIVFSITLQAVSSFNAMGEFVATGKAQNLLGHPLIFKFTAMVHQVIPDIKKYFPDFTNLKIEKLVMDTSTSLGKSFLNQSGQLAGNIGSLIANFFLMIFTFFFMVRDDTRLLDKVLHLVPLSATQEHQIMEKMKDVAKSALLGTFVTSLAQGVAGGFAFFICGLPALFWGMVMAFASLIPLVGTALIWIPACVYLLISGHPMLSLFLLIWSVVVVGGIDNILRPLFMQGGSDMPTLLIFFSILGGINTFGLLGLLYGPLIIGLAIVLLYIYNIEFKEFLKDQDRQ